MLNADRATALNLRHLFSAAMEMHVIVVALAFDGDFQRHPARFTAESITLFRRLQARVVFGARLRRHGMRRTGFRSHDRLPEWTDSNADAPQENVQRPYRSPPNLSPLRVAKFRSKRKPTRTLLTVT